MSKEEKEFHRLAGDCILAETDDEIASAWEKFDKYRKEHPVLADEIQSRRWLD